MTHGEVDCYVCSYNTLNSNLDACCPKHTMQWQHITTGLSLQPPLKGNLMFGTASEEADFLLRAAKTVS